MGWLTPVHAIPNFQLENMATLPAREAGRIVKSPELRLKTLATRLNQLQTLLSAERQHALLLVLQGMDTAGKDGVIRRVFSSISPLGVRAEAFGPPSELEQQHDFLWRIHQKAPRLGEIVIFNRSQYEDVLVPRVQGWIGTATWQKRYRHIVNFEALLHDQNVHILKCYLHISHQEQKDRLQARMNDPLKRWKLKLSDFEDRKHWHSYIQAYQDAMQATSTPQAPWFVIPSDVKSFRDLYLANLLVNQLNAMRMKMPTKSMHWSEADLD